MLPIPMSSDATSSVVAASTPSSDESWSTSVPICDTMCAICVTWFAMMIASHVPNRHACARRADHVPATAATTSAATNQRHLFFVIGTSFPGAAPDAAPGNPRSPTRAAGGRRGW